MPPIINGDGEQTRDFVYIDDVVEANMLAMHTEKGTGEAFNIATGKGVSINKVSETLKHILNKEDLDRCPRGTETDRRKTRIRRHKQSQENAGL